MLRYDPRKDFAPVGLIAKSALVVLVNPALSVHSIAELIALAKKQPGKLNYASAGSGSGIHLGTVLFEMMAGIAMTHIPYKGSGPALTDLIGGHVAIYFSSLPPAVGPGEGRCGARLRSPTSKRSAIFPDLLTVAGSGLALLFDAVLHYGIVAPAGTLALIIAKLSAAAHGCKFAGVSERSQPKAPSRCRPRRRNTPPTSTVRKPRSAGEEPLRRSDVVMRFAIFTASSSIALSSSAKADDPVIADDSAGHRRALHVAAQALDACRGARHLFYWQQSSQDHLRRRPPTIQLAQSCSSSLTRRAAAMT